MDAQTVSTVSVLLEFCVSCRCARLESDAVCYFICLHLLWTGVEIHLRWQRHIHRMFAESISGLQLNVWHLQTAY